MNSWAFEVINNPTAQIFLSNIDHDTRDSRDSPIKPNKPNTLPNTSTTRTLTKSVGSAASARAAVLPAMPTQRPQKRLQTPTVRPPKKSAKPTKWKCHVRTTRESSELTRACAYQCNSFGAYRWLRRERLVVSRNRQCQGSKNCMLSSYRSHSGVHG